MTLKYQEKRKKGENIDDFVYFCIMNIEPIAFFRSPLTSKFGVPRQSGIVSALRGLEAYDYLWLVWGFSENVEAEKHPTVRPPLLGGNERMGVWATRSPFRPNNLGLSSVRIAKIHADVPCVEVLGADLMDGTPIYDIKPYLPYVDSHPDARGGFTDDHTWQCLQVEISDEHAALFDAAELSVLKEVLSLDPRPHYHDDASREYGMPFKGRDVRFRVENSVLHVTSIEC